MVLDILAVDNFDFTRKIVKKKLGEKLVEMLGVLVKIEFLDKNLTFRIVCYTTSALHLRLNALNHFVLGKQAG